jgi:hypothetical protein
MNKLAIVTLTTTTLMGLPVSAAQITVGDLTYEVFTTSGNFANGIVNGIDLKDPENAPWWNDQELAGQFAVEANLGLSGLFAFFQFSESQNVQYAANIGNNPFFGLAQEDAERIWAYTEEVPQEQPKTPVPEPSTTMGLGALTIFAIGTAFKGKLAKAKN